MFRQTAHVVVSCLGFAWPLFQGIRRRQLPRTSKGTFPSRISPLLPVSSSFYSLPRTPPIFKTVGTIALIFALIHLGGHLLYMASEENRKARCLGWECEEVHCPSDKYAVYVPEAKAYLPCESFEEYVNTENPALLIKKGPR